MIIKKEHIEREAVVELFNKWADGYSYIEVSAKDAIACVRAIPAADVRPVVKAHWIDIWSKLDPDTSFEVQCSKCRIISDRPAGNFCKWCGADMREEN